MALKHQELTSSIIGVFYDVYNELGAGFLESVYEAATALALQEAGHRVCRQAPAVVRFRGAIVGEYRADLLVDDSVIVELKAARTLDPAHEAQLLNYLRATDAEVGLLLNFGDKPRVKRCIYENTQKAQCCRASQAGGSGRTETNADRSDAKDPGHHGERAVSL